MKKYVVKVIAVSGKNNRIHKYGSVVNESHFPTGNINDLVSKGYLELSKESKKAVNEDKKEAIKLLEKEIAEKEDFHFKLKEDFDLLEKPEDSLDSFQNLVDTAKSEFNASLEDVSAKNDSIKFCENKLAQSKTDAARKKADEKLENAVETFGAAKISSKKLSEAHEAAVDSLTTAHNRLKIYTDLEREVNTAASDVEVLKSKIKNFK